MESVQKQLEELGLSQNEVKAYLAALELGPATAQQIAAKAAVVRPTAYVAIGGLVKRGLMSSHTRGKKQFFQAERPEVLMAIVEDEKKRLMRNQEKIKILLPRLHALISVVGARPEVNYYEGMEGLQTMRAVLFSAKASDLMIVGSPEKYEEAVSKDDIYLHDVHLRKSALKVRQIVLYGKNKKLSPSAAGVVWKYLKVDELEPGEIAIFGDYIALIAYLDKPYGFLIKSREVARIGKRLFDAAWITAKPRP